MKVTCVVCGKVAFGSREDLIKKGWQHASGHLGDKIFVGSLCKEDFSPKNFLKIIGVNST